MSKSISFLSKDWTNQSQLFWNLYFMGYSRRKKCSYIDQANSPWITLFQQIPHPSFWLGSVLLFHRRIHRLVGPYLLRSHLNMNKTCSIHPHLYGWKTYSLKEKKGSVDSSDTCTNLTPELRLTPWMKMGQRILNRKMAKPSDPYSTRHFPGSNLGSSYSVIFALVGVLCPNSFVLDMH